MGDQEKGSRKGPNFAPLETQYRGGRRDRVDDSDFVTRMSQGFEATDPDKVNVPRWTDLGEAKEEEEKVLVEVAYGEDFGDKDNQRRARLVRDAHYYCLQIGRYYKDKPDLFRITRFLTFSEDEVLVINQLMAFIGQK